MVRTLGAIAKAVLAVPYTQGAVAGVVRRNAGESRVARISARRLDSRVRVTPGSSGTFHTASSAITVRTTCTEYGVSSGSGAHWAINPATSGPKPKPIERAMVERRAPTPGPSWWESSAIHALPGA